MSVSHQKWMRSWKTYFDWDKGYWLNLNVTCFLTLNGLLDCTASKNVIYSFSALHVTCSTVFLSNFTVKSWISERRTTGPTSKWLKKQNLRIRLFHDWCMLTHVSYPYTRWWNVVKSEKELRVNIYGQNRN